MQTQFLLVSLVGALIGGGFMLWYQTTPIGTVMSPITNNSTSRDLPMAQNRDGHMTRMQQMLVESERSFIEHMIPHHQEAIDTASEVLERGATTPAIEKLMQKIITAQTSEIASMQEWYVAWYGESHQNTIMYEPMMGELTNLSGAALDQAFLEDMIMHHMGAIMMARSVQPHIEHAELAELTQSIVSTQSAEIQEMRQLLANFE